VAGDPYCSDRKPFRHARCLLGWSAMFDFMWGYVMGQKSAAQASAFARSAGAADALTSTRKLNDVDERIDRLVMLVQAMWAILKEEGFTDEQLAAKLVEIDEADGSLDGRRTRRAADCRSCGSKVAAGLANCQFCGAAVFDASEIGPFDSM